MGYARENAAEQARAKCGEGAEAKSGGGRKSHGCDWFRPWTGFRPGGPERPDVTLSVADAFCTPQPPPHPHRRSRHPLPSPAMLRKTLVKGLRTSAPRSFRSSAPARRVVATSPVKAQQVTVSFISSSWCGVQLLTRVTSSHQPRRENIQFSTMSMTRS